MRLTSLTIVLPGLDVEHLREAVRAATRAAERCADRHEIVIVDDGRTDDTIALAGALAARDPRVSSWSTPPTATPNAPGSPAWSGS